jgi:hypothetical protein
MFLEIVSFITLLTSIFTYYEEDIFDKNLLYFALLGEFLAIFGYFIKNTYITEISHIIFILSLLIGSYCYRTNLLGYLILIVLGLTLLIRYYLKTCLFNIIKKKKSNNSEFMEKFYSITYFTLLLILSYKLSLGKSGCTF